MKSISYEQALSRLAAYCSRSEKCLQDVRKKLDQWELPSREKFRIIQSLQENNFLNEERYAFAFVRDKSRFNKWGKLRIELELNRKNIPSKTIEQALDQINPDESINQLIVLLKRKQKTIKAHTDFEARQKLMRFAAGRGFPLEYIEKAIMKIREQE